MIRSSWDIYYVKNWINHVLKFNIIFRYDLDQYATVGIARSQVDNRELVESWSYNLISEIDCVPPNPQNIDADLTLGMNQQNRYSKGR